MANEERLRELHAGKAVTLSGTIERVREDGNILVLIAGKWMDQFVLVDPSALLAASPAVDKKRRPVTADDVANSESEVWPEHVEALRVAEAATQPRELSEALKSVLRVLGTFLIDEHSTEDVVRDTVRRGWCVANGGKWSDRDSDEGNQVAALAGKGQGDASPVSNWGISEGLSVLPAAPPSSGPQGKKWSEMSVDEQVAATTFSQVTQGDAMPGMPKASAGSEEKKP